ncbi:MAG: hypothetical protein ACTSYA_04740, partial [Candidatus Kariarchaeaceae archaeon]
YSYPTLKPIRDSICRIVSRHTPTTMVPPETTEEKIVFDADCLDRLGLIGVLRGFIGKEGSIEEILESKMESRLHDFDRLNFEASRKIGKAHNDETLGFVETIRGALSSRKAKIEELNLRGVTGEDKPIESLPDEKY